MKLKGIGGGAPQREEGLSYKGHTVDALALRVDEGRGKLRKGMGSRKQAMIHTSPNGATRHESCRAILREDNPVN